MTLAFIVTIPADAFENADGLTINLKAGSRDLSFPAPAYYFGFALPNFYFHMATAYNILRANGVEVGKRDFLGGVRHEDSTADHRHADGNDVPDPVRAGAGQP
jgi:uncharacterized protein